MRFLVSRSYHLYIIVKVKTKVRIKDEFFKYKKVDTNNTIINNIQSNLSNGSVFSKYIIHFFRCNLIKKKQKIIT